MGALHESLGQALSQAHRTYAAFRPEVAEYLFERGFKKTEAALGEGHDALLSALFRLQMESIGSRGFGVSNDGWRHNAGWPDRYFPILWLDLIPRLLPLLPSERRLSALTLLFNLGENLVVVAPSLAGAVAEALVRGVPTIAREGVESAAIAALAELGIVPREALAARASPTGLVKLATFSLATWDPLFIPAAVGFDAEGAFWVADRVRAIALHLTRTGSSAQLVGRVATERVREPQLLPLHQGRLAIGDTGVVTCDGATIGQVDPRGVAGAALSPHGLLVITRRFSQSIELWSAL